MKPLPPSWLLTLALLALLAEGWRACVLVLLLGGVMGVQSVRSVVQAAAPRTRCPRGHPVEQYGRFRCGDCGAVSEGWVWRCRVCGAAAGWTSCRCGLAVRNPLMREDDDG